MTSSSKKMPFLVINQGPQPNQTFPLDKQIITIGRLEDNDIAINDPAVSRYHARLMLQDNQWVIEDLGSQNGTFINSRPISGPTYLAPGSQLGIGSNVILGMQGSTPMPAAPKRQAAPAKKSSRLPVLGGIAGLVLAGVLVVGALAAAGYFYFFSGASLPFGLSQASGDDPFAGGPSVVIQQPRPGEQVSQGDAIFFSATALDESGVIRIDLWVDDQVVLSQTNSNENGTTPFSLNYPLVATEEGTYALVARAYNNQGLMGESPVHHVSVTDAGAGATASTQDLGQYVVQEGDTLDSIARRAGTTVDAILAVNPDITNGQVTPGQVIVIPLPKDPPVAAVPSDQQGGQAGGQSGGQPGGQAGGQQGGQNNQPGILPGILPGVNFMPMPDLGNLQVAGGHVLPGVVLNPGPGAAGNPNARMKAPDPVQVSVVADCQVKVTWKDNANNESNYDIQRSDPGSAFGLNAAILAANTTEYVDTLPGSGKYKYEVVARQMKGGKIVDYVVSQPVIVAVPTTPACQVLPNIMRMIFQPVVFTATGTSQGFINPILDPAGSLLIFRLPQAQGTSIPLNQFGSDKYRIETWLPESRAGKDIVLSLAGNGVDQNKKPLDLGSFSATHSYQDLTGVNPTQVYQNKGQSQHGSFDFKYKFWLEPWYWGAANVPPSAVLKPPTNLQMKVVGGEHELTWDYDKDTLNKYVSGFNVYREYFCPGYTNNIGWPLPIPRGVVPAGPVQTVNYSKTITAAQLPQGCACSYQVSAFGQGGESIAAELKNPQDCLTFKANDDVTVTFKDVEISAKYLPKAQNAHIYLWANYYGNSTAQEAHLTSGKHSLGQIDFSSAPGVQPGSQPMTVGMGQGQSLQLGFYLGGICKGIDLVLKPPAGNSWAGVDRDYTVSSVDGGCKMTVHVKGSAAGQPGGQNQPGGQQGGQQGGVKCSGQDGCTVVFVNDGSHPITSLKIGNDPNNIVDVIQSVNQIILPGGSMAVKSFKDAQYAYAVEYGFLQNQQVALLLPGPAGSLGGTDGTVSIKDPTVQQLLSTYQVVASWSGPDILSNFACHRFDFYENGTFEFFINGQKSDSGTYGAQVSRSPGVYGITFNIKGTNYNFPNGTYHYAGAMAGLLYVETGAGAPSIVEYVQKQTCLGP
jgi:LysM repeat protein